jgi:type III secretion protein V
MYAPSKSIRGIGVALVIGGSLAALFIPFSPSLLDVLCIVNLCLSLLVLGHALFARHILQLSALPAILLLLTVFRLALSVSTSRAILEHGRGGQAIEMFGHFVLGGNIVAGIIVYIIIAVVQFIVISKGSERVAEVGARFVLDGLPGRQMSIDADIRSGFLSLHDAQSARKNLQLESRLFGTLDGSMKFIKGDAIASLLIVLAVILGGSVQGMIFKGMSISSALHSYILMAVGDGVSSQFASLMTALAAGCLITKVSDESNDGLASAIEKELLQSIPLLTAVGSLSVIALLYLGHWLFAIFFFIGTVWLLLYLGAQTHEKSSEVQPSSSWCLIPPRLEVKISAEVAESLFCGPVSPEIPTVFQDLRHEAYEKWGIPLEPITLSQGDCRGAQLYLFGTPISSPWIYEQQQENDKSINLKELGIYLFKVLKEVRSDLVDDATTRSLLDTLGARRAELVSHVVPSMVSVTTITKILRQCLREDISLSYFEPLIQAIAEAHSDGVSYTQLYETLRVSLRRHIVAPYIDGGTALPCFGLGEGADTKIRQSVDSDTPLEAQFIEELFLFFKTVEDHIPLVCSAGARAALRDLLQDLGIPRIVLGYNEVSAYRLQCKALFETSNGVSLSSEQPMLLPEITVSQSPYPEL